MSGRISKQTLIEHSGRERSDSVTRWLRSIGWNGAFDADGWPVVLPAWYADKIGGKAEAVNAGAYDVNVAGLRAA